MKIKEFLKEKKELIKVNRRLIAVGCGISAIMVAVPSITGVVTSHQAKNKKDDDKYYYTPGKIKFDENDKLIIPEVVDENNPSGNYEHKLPNNEQINFDNELFKQEKFKKDLKANLINTFDLILKNEKYMIDFKFEVTNDIKLLIKNLITDKDLELKETIHINDFMNIIVDECINNPNYEVMRQYTPEQLCAIVGINLSKEYNDAIIKSNDIENITLYGGAGALPNRPSSPTFNQPNNINLSNITIKEYKELVLKQNEYYQNIFSLTYICVLPVLIFFNFMVGLANILTWGSFAWLLFQTALDIVYASFQIKYSNEDLILTRKIIENINHMIEESKSHENGQKIISWTSPAEWFFTTLGSIVISPVLDSIILNGYKFNKNLALDHILRLKFSSLIPSFLSIAFNITMTILEGTLLKPYEI